MSYFNFLKYACKRIGNVFVKIDYFREHLENDLAHILRDASNFTSLDNAKEKIIQAALTSAISYAPVIGGVASSLSQEQIKIVSELIVLYGHKIEKALAKQLEK